MLRSVWTSFALRVARAAVAFVFEIIAKAHANKWLVILLAALVALTMIRSPGYLGADIRMMGNGGLKNASQMAILNANYMARRLEGAYRIVYKDEQGLVAHELIIDCKPFKKSAGVDVVDIAKRLMDYGSGEMDRLVESLLSIREEIAAIERGEMDRNRNPLKMAPHTLAKVVSESWDLPYPRELAAFPKPWCHNKTWPSVGRIDDQYGDRNLVCTCPPLESYQTSPITMLLLIAAAISITDNSQHTTTNTTTII